MTEQTGPEPTVPRDARHWAAKVDRLQVGTREGVRGTNVAGKRLTGPVQGFGKLWQKTYSVDIGSEVSLRTRSRSGRRTSLSSGPRGTASRAP